MVGNLVVEVEPAEPAKGKTVGDLLAQPALRPDAVTISDDEHTDQQLGIDLWPSGVAVVLGELAAQVGERGRCEHIDAAEQMIAGHPLVEVKLVKQTRLVRRPPRAIRRQNHCSPVPSTGFFNTIGPEQSLLNLLGCACSGDATRLRRKVLVEFPGLVPVGAGVLGHVFLAVMFGHLCAYSRLSSVAS